MKKQMDKIVRILKALACPTRLRIVVGLIDKKECNVNLMAEKLGLAQPNVSQHLTILKSAKIIKGYRKGTQICYQVVDESTKKIIEAINSEKCSNDYEI